MASSRSSGNICWVNRFLLGLWLGPGTYLGIVYCESCPPSPWTHSNSFYTLTRPRSSGFAGHTIDCLTIGSSRPRSIPPWLGSGSRLPCSSFSTKYCRHNCSCSFSRPSGSPLSPWLFDPASAFSPSISNNHFSSFSTTDRRCSLIASFNDSFTPFFTKTSLTSFFWHSNTFYPPFPCSSSTFWTPPHFPSASAHRFP